MESSQTTPRYSLIIPWIADQAILDNQIKSLSAIFDDETNALYEIVAVDRSHIKEVAEDLDRIKGDVLIIIDGELKEPPGLLKEMIDSFEKGADLALAGHYSDNQNDAKEPALVCFGIRRTALPRIKESPEGFGLALNILGPEAIKRMSGHYDTPGGHLTTYLKHLIEVDK
ncbi:hypothetical protein A2392_02460 [Candidatus Kaiserbacteria bacterium RIFOXYB1_FULL_46_14]|uniref:Glycosyltransferase 2-like domain-containing protein n=1 Tax=Candidatus Kaiserbacteria bacterium RIFOXYB1_FULL_46_14 TaxID=1798531 RepID=A0A1F6FIC7_9BACT|nr:MAG: hypothetical protein A2392_02460 [Candidatus Kaiserbacteria bacterium RIFOXYB1_FULL_46_14]